MSSQNFGDNSKKDHKEREENEFNLRAMSVHSTLSNSNQSGEQLVRSIITSNKKPKFLRLIKYSHFSMVVIFLILFIVLLVVLDGLFNNLNTFFNLVSTSTNLTS